MQLKIILFFLLPFIIHAQNDFSIIYNPDIPSNFNIIGGDIGGNLIVAGFDKNSTPTIYTLFKINAIGDIIWSRQYNNSEKGTIVDISLDADGSITMLGETTCQNEQGLFLTKLNDDGNVLWSRTYYNDITFYARKLAKSQNGGYIIGGTDYDFTFSISRISESGDLLWGKTFSRVGFQNLNGLFENEAGEIIFFGDYKGSMTAPSRGILGKMSANGNISWIKAYNTATQNANDDAFIGGVQADDGGYFLAGKRRVQAKLDILMTKIDNDGVVEWTYSFGGQETEVIFDVLKGSNCYYIIGRTSNYHPFYQYQIYKIGLDGSEIWARQFGLPDDAQFSVPAFTIGANNTIHALANTDSDVGRGAWVFTIDNEGLGPCLVDSINIILESLNPVVGDHDVFEQSYDQSNSCDFNVSSFSLTTTQTCQYIAAEFETSAAVICAGQCIDLMNASIIFPTNFQWNIQGGTPAFSNEENPNSICFHEPGIFNITLIAANDYNSDTITHNIKVLEAPEFIAYSDTLICTGDSFEITANFNDILDYEWSTGSLDSSIIVQDTGVYIFIGTTPLCEDFMDSVYIYYFDPLNNLNIGNSVKICLEDELEITVDNQAFVNYVWSNGVPGPLINITEPETYFLTANGICDTLQSNEIVVEFEDCSCPYEIPNAFTPNGDGINDLFGINADCALINFKMEIWNRWGKKVASLDAIDSAWDGNFNGTKSPSDVYVYIMTGVLESNAGPTEFEERGNVTLIR